MFKMSDKYGGTPPPLESLWKFIKETKVYLRSDPKAHILVYSRLGYNVVLFYCRVHVRSTGDEIERLSETVWWSVVNLEFTARLHYKHFSLLTRSVGAEEEKRF